MTRAVQNLFVGRLKQYVHEIRTDVQCGYRRLRAKATIPAAQDRDRWIVESLQRTGACITSLQELGIAGSKEILEAGDAVTNRLAERPVADGKFTVSATTQDIASRPELIQWGLSERLLRVVANYIGVPVAYRGLTVRRDIVGGPVNETRMWHRDNEDNRIVKIIVYLNALDNDDGPFEYVPRTRTPPSWRVPIIDSSRVSDEELVRLVPEHEWRACTGPRGTIVFVDTCRVFHRGRVASRNDRRTLFYCYNSQRPMNPQWCGQMFDAEALSAALPEITPLQRQAIRVGY